jgi:hypothetical protein
MSKEMKTSAVALKKTITAQYFRLSVLLLDITAVAIA